MTKKWEDLDIQELTWKKNGNWLSGMFDYSLQDADGKAVATIKKRSIWNTRVEIDAPGNRWVLERKGFWRRRVEITSVATGESPATFYYKGWGIGGELHFADGRVYRWGSSSWTGSKWAWTDEYGQPLIGFHRRGAFVPRGELYFDAATETMPSVPLLVFLGWYLVLLYQMDAAAAAAS